MAMFALPQVRYFRRSETDQNMLRTFPTYRFDLLVDHAFCFDLLVDRAFCFDLLSFEKCISQSLLPSLPLLPPAATSPPRTPVLGVPFERGCPSTSHL